MIRSAVALLILSTVSANADTRLQRTLCATEASGAMTIMGMRQQGMPFNAVEQLVRSPDAQTQAVYRHILESAYRAPLLEGAALKKEAGFLFGQEVGKMCRKRLGI